MGIFNNAPDKNGTYGSTTSTVLRKLDMLIRWLREPLLHFLVIGAVLFAVYDFQDDEPLVANANLIVISQTKIDALINNWEKKWQRPPTQIELDGLVEREVREQVLYQEALALGLDRNDPVVRRRLAQKIEFLSSDIAAQLEPTEEDLELYLAANPQKFELPAYISFKQIYLNADRRGLSIEEDARLLLKHLEQSPADLDISMLGDSFMFGQVHDDLPGFAVSRLFGSEFTDVIFGLPVGKWQGPVRSGLGFHLIRIDSRTPAKQPELSAVRDKVRFEWMAVQKDNMNESLYQGLRQKYDIILPLFE
jgi:peptidyl-prolyl cis-trans isomerase C